MKFSYDIIIIICLSPQMNTLGSASKWPSYDSLSSASSHLLSESEHTEDEADVFSEGEGDSGTRKSVAGDHSVTLPGKYLDFPVRSDRLSSRSKVDQPARCHDDAKRPDPASPRGVATLSSSLATPGDLAFAQKVSLRFSVLVHQIADQL